MKKLLRIIAVAASLTIPVSANAQGIPVIDSASIANLITQITNQQQQITNQVQQITEMKNQLQNMQQRLEAMTGAKGISSILNSAGDKVKREAADSLFSIIDGTVNGSISGSNTQTINSTVSKIKDKLNLSNIAEFDNSEVAQDRGISLLATSGIASIATAEDSYSKTNEATERVNTLIDSIDNTADLKASVDLNSRLLAEVITSLNEMTRVQASMAAAVGANAATVARDRAAGRKFGRIGGTN